MHSDSVQNAVQVIQERLGDQTPPRVGIVIGSGLGPCVELIENPVTISYHDLENFPQCSVEGHLGQLILGTIADVPIVCLQGRIHYYEGTHLSSMKTMVRTLKALGCEIMLSTNASGSLCKKIGPGELMLVRDHINMQANNPLIGPNDDAFGPRFFSMNNGYDERLRSQIKAAGKKLKIKIKEGVYIGTLGPNYETPAEIKAFKAWGADLVGMSTIPEVLIANHCGLRVAAIAAITNYAAGLAARPITHQETLNYARESAEKLSNLIKQFLMILNTKGE